MSTRSLVDELSEDREHDEKIIKSFYSKPTLSLEIFEKSGDTYKMLDSVRDRLLIITDKFIEFLGVEFFVYDAVLTGSLANYNWSEYSDVDLHVLIDYDESNHSNVLLAEFFAAKKNVWNSLHDITIKGFEVEMYVQDVKEPHISSGVYSILNDKWIVEPQKSKKYVDDRGILEKGEEYANLIDSLEVKNKLGIDVTSEVESIKKKLKRFRQSGLDKGGEYSYENLTFKLLRRNGYIKKLIDLKKEAVDNKLSVH
ncbi:MAG TPA: hypothetical protein VMX17_09225 [Candidatus Glassbacteria bacterium]|nr:hypothetical protein [Candidatus Glassbacteria bacterium]